MIKWLRKKAKTQTRQWLGWEEIKNFAEDIPLPGRAAIADQKDLLSLNLAEEDDLRKAEFEDVLRSWGIRNQEELDVAIKSKKLMRLCGIAITVMFLAYWSYDFFLVPKSVLWRSFDGLAGLSFLSAGVVIWLTSAWRLRVFRHRRFVPFTAWLAGFWKREKVIEK